MRVVQFLPWCTVKPSIEVGPIRLLRYEVGTESADFTADERAALDAIRRSFVNRNREPVRLATVVRRDHQESFARYWREVWPAAPVATLLRRTPYEPSDVSPRDAAIKFLSLGRKLNDNGV